MTYYHVSNSLHLSDNRHAKEGSAPSPGVFFVFVQETEKPWD